MIQHSYPTPHVLKLGTGRCFGTFGELMQGVLPDGRHVLVTLPISQYATAWFAPVCGVGVRVFPPHKEKSRRLAEQLVRRSGIQTGGILSLSSDLPEGKGMASSSADMVATARAIQQSLGFALPEAELAAVMAGIEPTDGVMFQEIVSFHHKEGVVRRFLGCLPPLTIVAVDEGGIVDTVSFNHNPPCFSSLQKSEYAELLETTETAILSRDLSLLGTCATRSAELNQKVLSKTHLEQFVHLQKAYGALGVVVAHSGTMIGMLLDPAADSYSTGLSAITGALSMAGLPVTIYQTHHLWGR